MGPVSQDLSDDACLTQVSGKRRRPSQMTSNASLRTSPIERSYLAAGELQRANYSTRPDALRFYQLGVCGKSGCMFPAADTHEPPPDAAPPSPLLGPGPQVQKSLPSKADRESASCPVTRPGPSGFQSRPDPHTPKRIAPRTIRGRQRRRQLTGGVLDPCKIRPPRSTRLNPAQQQ